MCGGVGGGLVLMCGGVGGGLVLMCGGVDGGLVLMCGGVDGGLDYVNGFLYTIRAINIGMLTLQLKPLLKPR